MKQLLTLLLLTWGLTAVAQPTPAPPADSIRYWATHPRASLNANEAILSKNWKSGGTSSVGLSLLFNGTANYQRSHHTGRARPIFSTPANTRPTARATAKPTTAFISTPNTATTSPKNGDFLRP